MRLSLTGAMAALMLAGCAVQPGTPSVKVHHGESPPPPFAQLNYEVDLGRRCSPADGEGRRYASYIWLRANRADGGYDPLRATAENCTGMQVVGAQ